MNLDKIEKLVKIIEESSLQEFSIQEGDIKIKMSKRAGESVAVPFAPGMGMPVAGTAAPEAATADETSGAVEEETYITSPIVGTFYSAPSPEAKAFVKVGDRVKAGETVCILEAMKLMNEIESEFDGTVKEIESDFDCEIEAVLVSNEQRVEYGQPLFKVKKLDD